MKNSMWNAIYNSIELKTLGRALVTLMCIFNGVAVFYLVICPLLPLLFISPEIFRKVVGTINIILAPPFCLNLKLMGLKVIGSGDFIASDSSILLMNHRTRIDPLFLAPAMYDAIGLQVASMKVKIVMQDIFRHVPILGWILQIYGCMFVNRRWDKDKVRLSNWLDYMIETERHFQILLFPEGVLYKKKTLERSDEYARSHGLPEYKYVLHPKVTGFRHIVKRLQEANYLDSVYDVTIGLSDPKPQIGWGVYFGTLSNEIHINVKKIVVNEIPWDDVESGLWLQDLWKQKEQKLKDFYENKTFPGEIWPSREWNHMSTRVVYILGNSLTAITLLLFIMSSTFRLYALCFSILFVILSFYDVHHLEIDWFQLRKSYRAKSSEKVN